MATIHILVVDKLGFSSPTLAFECTLNIELFIIYALCYELFPTFSIFISWLTFSFLFLPSIFTFGLDES